jgi:nicotinamide phosphoribosyltransferase
MFRNPCLNADAYTISSNVFASDAAKQVSGYNMVNRYSPTKHMPDLAYDSRMVMYGLQDWIKDYMTTPVTTEDVKLASTFMKRAHSFGGYLPFPETLWNRIVNDHNGFLPLEINAIPEGSTFFPNEPIIQVRNTSPGFGEFAAYIEKSLLGRVSTASACATLCRHWLERMREQVKIDLNTMCLPMSSEDIDKNARFQIHNFGARACLTDDESIILGKAHLLSFHGTDNFDAAYSAWMEGALDPTGTSIMALAHRNVQGHKTELDAFIAGTEATKGQSVRIVSLVADCYNYYDAIETICKMAKENEDVIHVIRPDSGDAYNTLAAIYKACIFHGLFKLVNGWKVPTNVRFIYGDSVKPKKQFEVMNKLRSIGMLPTQWGIWGVGGYIRNTPNRDIFSSAYKLCYTADELGVVKLSEDAGKLSIPFWNSILRRFDGNQTITVHPYHILFTKYEPLTVINDIVYKNGITNFRRNGSFADIQNRAINDFDKHKMFAFDNPDFGLNRENLHAVIVEKQDEFYAKYRN